MTIFFEIRKFFEKNNFLKNSNPKKLKKLKIKKKNHVDFRFDLRSPTPARLPDQKEFLFANLDLGLPLPVFILLFANDCMAGLENDWEGFNFFLTALDCKRLVGLVEDLDMRALKLKDFDDKERLRAVAPFCDQEMYFEQLQSWKFV